MDAGAAGYGGCSVSSDCGESSIVGGDTLNSDVYRQKLRSAFIEQQNSLSAGRLTASSVGSAAGFRAAHGVTARSLQQRWQPASSTGRITVSMDHGLLQPPQQQGSSNGGQLEQLNVAKRPQWDRSGLHRSNSSLELDRYAGYDLDDLAMVKSSSGSGLRRDFGSFNSLDTVDSSFPSYVKSYRRDIERLDVNDGNAVPDRSNVVYPSTGSNMVAISSSRSMDDAYIGSVPGSSFAVNGNELLPTAAGDDDLTSSTAVLQSNDAADRSPNVKSKSQKSKDRKARAELNSGVASTNSGGGSLFRKLRGVKSDPSATAHAGNKLSAESAEGNPKLEERQRRKAFAHYDCQSIGVNLPDLIKRRAGSNNDDCGVLRRTNTTTGASAASHRPVVHGETDAGGSGDSSHAEDESVEVGDGKSNSLVESCFNFRNELGGEEERVIWIDRKIVNVADRRSNEDLISSPLCNAVAILDSSVSPDGVVESPTYSYNNFVFEHIDHGTFYYRRYFNTYDHQNYFGIDENLGPVAVSIKRERVYDGDRCGSNSVATSGNKADPAWSYQYRLIVRTSELTTLRGSILEECIPSTSKLSSARGLSPKDILDYVVPSLNVTCLRHAAVGQKIHDQLMKLDEQRMSKTYKIGIMLCGANQCTEEEMYNNEKASPAFDEFLDFIGQRVRLKGFEKYRGGLDYKTDSTGLESLYTKLEDFEIMFHVSTLLPFTPNNRQQLLRKRHIGNDIVTIIFQEPGALPFTPKSVRSQFQHVFIVVRAHCSKTEPTKYSFAVSRSKNVPHFGPPFPKNALFEKSERFRDFLLVKAINAENAVHRSCKFYEMAVRTRQAYLADLASNYVTTSIDSGSRLGKFSLGSGRKKDKSKLRTIPDVNSKAAVVWNVTVEDASLHSNVDCYFSIATKVIVIVDENTRDVICVVNCDSVIGWTQFQANGIRIYFNQGECISVFTTKLVDCDEVKEISARLSVVTNGCQTEDLSLQRNAAGQLGFHVSQGGIVTDVESNGLAIGAGLRPNSRLVRVCDKFVFAMSHEQVVDTLRMAKVVRVTLLPPHDDGNVRRAVEDLKGLNSQLRITGSQSSINACPETPPAVPTKLTPRVGVHNVNLPTSPPLASIGVSEPASHHQGSSTEYCRPMPNDSGDSWRPAVPSSVSSHSELRLDEEKSSITGNNGNGQWNIYPAYGRESMKNSQTHSHRSDSIKNNQHGTNVNFTSVSRTYSVTGRPSLESSRPIPPPKPVFSSGDPNFASLTLGRRTHRKVGASGDWHSGGSDSAGSPDFTSSRYGSESQSSVNDLNSNTVDVLQSSRNRLNEKTREDAIPGQTSGVVVSLPVSYNSNSNHHGSENHHRSYRDLFVESDNPNHLYTSADSNTRSRTFSSHKTSPSRVATSSKFEADLMRLIDTDISVGDLHRTSSDKSGRRTSTNYDSRMTLGSTGQLHSIDGDSYRKNNFAAMGSLTSDLDDRSDQRSAGQTTIDIPGTNYRLRANPSALSYNNLSIIPAVPLPDTAAENMDWNSLVAVANRALEGNGVNAPHSVNSIMTNNRSNNSASTRDLSSNHMEFEETSSDGGRSLEARVMELERMLDKESKERELLENEVNSLRKQNARLQEESYAAAAQLRRFSGWFFNTIDKR